MAGIKYLFWLEDFKEGMDLLGYLKDFRDSFHWLSKEFPGNDHTPWKIASNSELRRWITSGAIFINGKIVVDPFWKVEFPVTSFVLFPKGNVCTIFMDDADWEVFRKKYPRRKCENN